MGSLQVAVREGLSLLELAARSRDALDRPLAAGAELLVASVADEGLVLGAFQRAGELPDDILAAQAGRITRRVSGGAEIRVSPGSVWLTLALQRPDVLVAGPPDRLMNRHVRPLLRALAKQGVKAGYFDRDWVGTADKRVVASVAFAHDAGTKRSVFEAVVTTGAPLAVRERGSWRGRPSGVVPAEGLAAAIAAAYLEAYAGAPGEPSPAPADADPETTHAAWSSTFDEAIGVIGAARDASGIHLGGELMVSRDAVATLESRLSALPALDEASVGPLVDGVLAAPGVALFGVRSLRSIRDVLLALGP